MTRTLQVIYSDLNRADYLDRGYTPHLLDISKQGLRAKSMRPVFPVGVPLWPYAGMLMFRSSL